MEEQKEPEDIFRELKQDALVEKLVTDPSKTPDVQVWIGFLGKGSEAEKWRLYLTPQLNSYVEFSAEDVVHTQPLDMPLACTMVWVRSTATLKHTQTGTLQAQAEFVQGDIMSSFMPGPSMQTMVIRGRPGGISHVQPCTLWGPGCPTIWSIFGCSFLFC